MGSILFISIDFDLLEETKIFLAKNFKMIYINETPYIFILRYSVMYIKDY